ncbi:MAG TPA: winged helix DNA-binding domain-containing protein [Actinomycetes bacterium]|jgi:hypothetical protein|nr:winged helix DNA-binding domain-containing protein [Actinomycetes bacterium]
MAELSWAQVAAWRMSRGHLAARVGPEALIETVEDICGLHAQIMSSAELSVWARVSGVSRADLQTALWEERRLVKLWAMRGTLHLLSSARYPDWQAALNTYEHFNSAAFKRYFGVGAEEINEIVAAIRVVLADGPLTREEMAQRVADHLGIPERAEQLTGSWGPLLKPASFRGALCFAPSDGQRVRFARPDRWLPALSRRPVDAPAESASTADGDQAVREVLRRYLRACGPASREDFARWWAISAAKAGKRIRELTDEVVQVSVAGEPRWLLAEDRAGMESAKPARVVRLLPAFDPYVIGITGHSEQLLPDPQLRARVHRPQGWVSPVLVVDGRLAGIWQHEVKAGTLIVTVEPFGRQPAWVRRSAVAEADLLADFLGAAATEVTWTRQSD